MKSPYRLDYGFEDTESFNTAPFNLPLALYFAASSQNPTALALGASATSLLTPTLVQSTNGNPFGITLVWDSTVNTSAASIVFQSGVINAARLFDNALSDNITVNLQITNSGTTGASAGPTTGFFEPLSLTKTNLSTSHPLDVTFAKLPSGNTVQSQSTVAVWNAQLKLWGLTLPTNTPILNGITLDGVATFGLQIPQNALVGVVLHELHHALGGVPYGSAPDIFDLFRFTAPGKMLFTAGNTAPAAYFSIDGGIIKLAYFGMTSDPSDFLNGIPTGGGKTVYDTTYDAFSEFYYGNGASYQYLSAVDLHLLDALGFHLSSLQAINISTFNTYSGNSPVVISDSAVVIQNSLDGLNTNINKIYSISASDPDTVISISAVQSVNDQSVLMLMSDYQNLKLSITGTSGNDTICGVAGTDTINGLAGINTISLNYHTTTDTLWHNAGVTSANLDKVTGFLPTDNITLANSSTSLNGICNLYSGATIAAGTSAATSIKSVAGGSAFTVATSADLLDITGKTFANLTALISDLSTSGTGHTYATFGNSLATGSHILVEYNGSDGLHLAEITQGTGASAKHLASNSTAVDLIDLIGVTQHLTVPELTIGMA